MNKYFYLTGIPGYDTTTICEALSKEYSGLKVINVNKKFPIEMGIAASEKVFEFLLGEFIKFDKEGNTNGYLISGFPRNLTEAQEFDKHVNNLKSIKLQNKNKFFFKR